MSRTKIPPLLRFCSFGSYNWSFNVDQNKEQYNYLRKFVRSWPQKNQRKKGLYFTGELGVGKTHLAVAFLKICVYRTLYRARFVTQQDLTMCIRKLVYEHDDLYSTCCDVPILLIDDFGYGAYHPMVQEYMFNLINKRINFSGVTILTTNCEPNELLQFLGDRVLDRLPIIVEGIELKGKSYRQKG